MPAIRILAEPVGIDADVAVVIDVIRAFTTAAHALAAGAAAIVCVEHVDDALAWRATAPDVVLLGEVRGLRPDGFDLGNSPTDPTPAAVAGRMLVQRTSNGTRGLVAASAAGMVAAAGATTVAATAAWVTSCRPGSVDLVATGSTSEDLACAEHLAALLRGEAPPPGGLAAAVRAARTEHEAAWRRPRSDDERALFTADLERCATVDAHPFAMVADQRTDRAVRLVPRPEPGRRS